MRFSFWARKVCNHTYIHLHLLKYTYLLNTYIYCVILFKTNSYVIHTHIQTNKQTNTIAFGFCRSWPAAQSVRRQDYCRCDGPRDALHLRASQRHRTGCPGRTVRRRAPGLQRVRVRHRIHTLHQGFTPMTVSPILATVCLHLSYYTTELTHSTKYMQCVCMCMYATKILVSTVLLLYSLLARILMYYLH